MVILFCVITLFCPYQCHDLRMAKIILLHFGAFVPGIQQPSKPAADETDEGDATDPCSNSQMTDGCKGIYDHLKIIIRKMIIVVNSNYYIYNDSVVQYSCF